VSGWLALLAWALGASALHLRGRRRLVLAARAGHEVRGPLATAQLALDGLERSARVDAIALELRRAALALDDLSGRPREAIARVDVGRLLSHAAYAWQALADANGVTLEVEPGRAVVVGDGLRLTQACANLVANAIEHGAPTPSVVDASDPSRAARARSSAVADASAPPPVVRARSSPVADASAPPPVVCVRSSAVAGRVLVEVRDFGPGLPAPLTVLIDAARGRRAPRGHGLAIAAAVAERHGGRLVSFPAERGAHLVLDLPEAPAP
jgi:signal transduction histidine kinase